MSAFAAALLGGFIGGVLGVVGTLVSSYWGPPRRLEEWRDPKREDREYGRRKKLLREMLEDERFDSLD